MLNSVFLKDKYLNLVLPEFSTEAGRVSREKEPRESVDRNFEVLKSLGAEEILGVIEHKQAVKVEERTEPPAAISASGRGPGGICPFSILKLT